MSCRRQVEPATMQDREHALVVAADVLEERVPKNTTARAVAELWQNRLDVHCAWHWPGVVRVTMNYSGALLAESQPGRPRELNRALFESART
jgi:hypothetical protein